MNITVYLGANEGNDPSLRRAAQELGTWIGKSGNGLVYGGSKVGLMGEIAQSALNAGGEVTGVEPQFFVERELQYESLTRLIVTRDMAERKAKMIELGDAFIALPGGTGTLEEITEVMSKVSLNQLDAPCILYNLDGYYDSLKWIFPQKTGKTAYTSPKTSAKYKQCWKNHAARRKMGRTLLIDKPLPRARLLLGRARRQASRKPERVDGRRERL